MLDHARPINVNICETFSSFNEGTITIFGCKTFQVYGIIVFYVGLFHDDNDVVFCFLKSLSHIYATKLAPSELIFEVCNTLYRFCM